MHTHLLAVVLLNAVKALALLTPLALLTLALRRIHVGQPHVCELLNYLCGFPMSMLFYGAALCTRLGIPVRAVLADSRPSHALHFPFPTALALKGKTTLLHLWNAHYLSFWSEALNPLRYPLVGTVAQIGRIPRGDGLFVFAALGLLGLISAAIGQYVNGSAAKQLLAIALSLVLGWYIVALGVWTGAPVGFPVLVALLALFTWIVRDLLKGGLRPAAAKPAAPAAKPAAAAAAPAKAAT